MHTKKCVDSMAPISYLEYVCSERSDSNVYEEHDVDVLYECFDGFDTKRCCQESFVATKPILFPIVPPFVDELSLLNVDHVPHGLVTSCHAPLP